MINYWNDPNDFIKVIEYARQINKQEKFRHLATDLTLLVIKVQHIRERCSAYDYQDSLTELETWFTSRNVPLKLLLGR